MNFDIITVLLGQLVRHFLTIAAGLLTAYGVTADEATAIVGPATAILVSLFMFLISQIWSFGSKKAAFETPTGR